MGLIASGRKPCLLHMGLAILTEFFLLAAPETKTLTHCSLVDFNENSNE